jgi:hypothetical protein
MAEQKSARKTARKTAERSPRAATAPTRQSTTSRSNGRTAGLATTTDDGAAVVATVDKTAEVVLELGKQAEDAPVSRVGETAADSNVADELSGGGVAFGEFVKSVGLAVASAQSELDKNLRETAKQLSETQIDVIAVFEQQNKDDDGLMDKGVVHLQKLPLINYLMPTAYAWKRVHLEADMNVQEFNARAGINIQQKSFAAGMRASGGFGVFGGGFNASAYAGFSSSSTGVDSSVSQDTAAGKLHMEATLEPRSDVELPKPFVLQKGPQLEVQVGSRTEAHQDGDETKPVVAQKVALTALLKKTDGAPNETKPLTVSISDPSLNYTSLGKTDAKGEMKIEVTRKVFNPAEDKPVQALVRVSFGLVTRSVGIVL